MVSEQFKKQLTDAIEERFGAGKVGKKNTTAAFAYERVRGQGLEFNAIFDVESKDEMDPATLEALEVAALERIERILMSLDLNGEKYTHKSKGKVDAPSTATLRLANGNITNIPTLQTLLNLTLQESVKELMGSGGRLTNRTGRFADSVEVDQITLNQNNNMSLHFKYMFHPYSVFDKLIGKAPWATPQRDPRALISQAIRNSLKKILLDRSLSQLSIRTIQRKF